VPRKTLAAVVTALWLGLVTPAVVVLAITWNGQGENPGIFGDRDGTLRTWLIYACCLWLVSAAATVATWHSVYANPIVARLNRN
jgi:hypothetical protein